MDASLARIATCLPPPLRRAATAARVALFAQFLRFGLVGLVGFAFDTATVYALRAPLGLYGAGMVSYLVAGTVTWGLNRSWTFRGLGGGPVHRQWALFLAANLAGFILNRGTYAALIAFVPVTRVVSRHRGVRGRGCRDVLELRPVPPDGVPLMALAGLRVTPKPDPEPRIAVLIPCYNEEVAIPGVVADFRAALPTAVIYVYDNNSRDRTIAAAREAGAVVRSETLQGKGHVVRRMFADIEADIYVLVDGDGTYDATAAPEMVRLLLDGRLDMVNGARVSEARAAYRRGHRFGNSMITGLVRSIFGKGVSDMLSGYRVFSRRFVKSFPALSAGFETETEFTVHALELNMPIAEIRTAYRERPEGSASKLRTYTDGFRILRTILVLAKEERPLQFFSLAGLRAAAAGHRARPAGRRALPRDRAGAAAAHRGARDRPRRPVLPRLRLRPHPRFRHPRAAGDEAAGLSGDPMGGRPGIEALPGIAADLHPAGSGAGCRSLPVPDPPSRGARPEP